MSDLGTMRERLHAQRRNFRLLPVGSPGTGHRWIPARRRPRGIIAVLGYGLSMGATAGGLVLAMSPATGVAMTATSYRIGDTTLQRTGAGTFTGRGVLVMSPPNGAVVRAAADVVIGGKNQTGVCFVSSAQEQERCIFAIGTESLSAVDTWTGSGWNRRYDDGQQIAIPATTMAPVPFAVGR